MSGNDAAVAAPQNMVEVEQMVLRLYTTPPGPVIQQIERQLQLLQRSSDGWQMGDVLLGSSDRNVRFFGALTFSVKLINDGSVLDPELS
nr:importin beta-like protein [Quercus suber]